MKFYKIDYENLVNTAKRDGKRMVLLKRHVYNETPIRIEYYLTQKGKELQPIMEQMALFSLKYCCDPRFHNPDPIKIEKITAKSIRNYM